jgi:hypothetical protein
MPEIGFIDIGRGSLEYRTDFDPDNPGVYGKNPLLALGALLGAKLISKAGKWGAQLWERTGGKLIKSIKAGLFGKGTRNASEAAKTIEEESIKDGDKSVAKTLRQDGIAGEAIEGSAVDRSGQEARQGAAEAMGKRSEKWAVKEGEKVGAELLVKEGEKGVAKFLEKKIPLVALLVGGVSAWERWTKEKDFDGAMDEIKSGLAATVPGFGSVLSGLMDLNLMGRDVLRGQIAGEGIDPNRKLSATGELISDGIAVALPGGALFESTTRTAISGIEALSEKGAFEDLGREKLTPVSEGMLAVEQTVFGEQLAGMTRPLAALAENMMGLHQPSASTAKPTSDRAQLEQEEIELRKTLEAQAPERAALQTEAMYSGHPTQVDQVDADQARDLERTYEETQSRLQSLEKARAVDPPDVPGANSSLLAKIQAIEPSPNLRAYLPASLSGADRSGIQTARAAGKEKEAVERFKKGLNVAPLSTLFSQAIRGSASGNAPEIPQLEQEEQTVGAN